MGHQGVPTGDGYAAMVAAARMDRHAFAQLYVRYGDFVRYKPPVNAKTLLLWYGPIALLVLGFGVLAFILIRRRRGAGINASNTLSEADRARLATLLDKKQP